MLLSTFQGPRELPNTKERVGVVRHFLTRLGSKADVHLIGKAVNRNGECGMEVPGINRFIGQKSNIAMLKSSILTFRITYVLETKKTEAKRTTKQRKERQARSKN